MKTTADFLNDLKAKYGLKSNYALAKKLGQTDTDIARWMRGKNTFSDEKAIVVAEMLEVDAAYVVACIHAERAKHSNEKALWERIATMAAGVTVAVAVFVLLPFVSLPPLNYEGPTASAETLYIMSNAITLSMPPFVAQCRSMNNLRIRNIRQIPPLLQNVIQQRVHVVDIRGVFQ